MGNANSSLESTRDDLESTRDDLESTRDDSGSMNLERTGTNVAVAGELVGLLKIDNTSDISTDQCIKHLDRVIELLPRHIKFMTSHSDDIIDMHEFGLMCMDIYKRYKLVNPDSFNFETMPSNESFIKDETKLLHHLKIIADILKGSKKQDLPEGGWKWRNLKMFLYHMAHMSFSPHKDQLRENFHEIANYLEIRDGHYHEWGTTMRCIRWYIETLKKIIDMIQTNTLDPKYAANLDEYILVPGCNLFGISKTDPMTTLIQLVSSAEELLRFNMSLIEIDWIARRQTLSSLIPVTRRVSAPHLAAKANKAKVLLTSVPSITSEEREKMLARGGIMTSLLDDLVQPPSQMHKKELDQLKRMISKRRGKDAGSRRRKKTRKNKHSIKPNKQL